MKAVFLDYATVSTGDLDGSVLTAVLPELQFYPVTAAAEMPTRIGAAEIVILNGCTLSAAMISTAPHLKLIALAATGTDNVDLAAARDRGIAVCNVRDYCSQSVMQHTWGMILCLTQHIGEYGRLVRDGSWVKDETSAVLAYPIRELAGRIFGVVGWGHLGRAAAGAAEAFGMRVIVASRRGAPPEPERVELAHLLATADIVSLHCPLNDATRGLIGARELALMRPDALLINTARGGLIDGQALAEALKARRLGGAGIDVLSQEPPVHGDPLLDPDIPNLVLSPHVAWAAREARQRCLDEIAANVQDFLRGGRRARVV